MTERWRKKLGDLDKHGPSDDVFERAKQGPMHAEDPLPHVATSRRIVTAVAAFAVFALAISVFAIPALRLNGTGAAGSSSGLFPLWPTQTPDDLQALQAQADAGQAEWALDPSLLAGRFAEQVLGWDGARVQRIVHSCPVIAGSASSVPPGPESLTGSDPGWVDSYADQSYCVENPATASASFGPPTTAGPTQMNDAVFQRFMLIRSFEGSCPDITVADVCAMPLVPRQVVTLFQPLEQGNGQIWAVFSAESEASSLSVVAGQNVRDGASVSGGFVQNQKVTLGYSSCGVSAGSSRFDGSLPMGAQVTLNVKLAAGSDCTGPQHGYVWGAVGQALAPDEALRTDPLHDGVSEGSLMGITAVPVTMTFPEMAPVEASAAATSDEPTVSPSAEPPWSTIKDVMGWTMSYPSDWTAAVFGEKDKVGHAVYSGSQGPLTGVVVDVWTDPTAAGRPADDSSFPLDASAVIGDGTFRADGILFHVDVTKEGSSVSQLSGEEEQTVLRIVSSITFKPWSVGQRRGEWTSVGDVLPSASAQWITYEGMRYLTSYGPPRRLFGPKPDCPSGGGGSYEIRETGQAIVTCPDGTTAAWDFTTGEPLASNPAWCSASLGKYEAVLSWDGQLLVRFPENTVVVGPSPSVTPSP